MEEIINFFKLDPKNTKVAFISTAANPYEDKWFITKDWEKWIESGFNLTDIDIKTIRPDECEDKLKDFDILYFAGGNTFYLMQEIKKCGFDKTISKLLSNGLIYIGGSAGAVVLGSTLEHIKTLDKPEKAKDLKDYSGLNLVNFDILPHSNEKNEKMYKDIIEEYSKLDIRPLGDNEVIFVVDNEITFRRSNVK